MRIITDCERRSTLVAKRVQEALNERPMYIGAPRCSYKFPDSGISVTRDCDIYAPDSLTQELVERIVLNLAKWDIRCRVRER